MNKPQEQRLYLQKKALSGAGGVLYLQKKALSGAGGVARQVTDKRNKLKFRDSATIG